MSAGEEAVASELPRAGGRLVLCPTPIGNLRDITLRALDVLRDATAIACEDTRRTRILLDRHGIDGALVSLHEHNEAARVGALLARVGRGETVALVSDAGTPLVSDPGYGLVRACIAADLAVVALPGPSSVTTALVASGLPCERWQFVGFLPRRRGELLRLLGETPVTVVAFESPARLPGTLAALAELDNRRPVAVCRELTKLHEDIRRGTAAELAEHYRENPPRGEVAMVVGAASADTAARGDALVAVRELVEAGARPRAAAAAVARLTGIGANELYRLLLV